MGKRKKLGVVIAIIVISVIWFLALRPEPDVKATFSNEIEKIAAERGINVVEGNSTLIETLKKMETEGGVIIKAKNIPQFFNIIGEKTSKIFILSSVEGGMDVRRKYLVLGKDFAVEIEFAVTPPVGFYNKFVLTSDGIIFEKDYKNAGVIAFLLTGIAMVFIIMLLL